MGFLKSIKWRKCAIYVLYDYVFHTRKWIIGIYFCKINYNLGLYTHICWIYLINKYIYNNFVQAMFESLKNSYVNIYTNI